MYITEYDEHSFELVAKVLWQINPCLRQKYVGESELIASMKFQTDCHMKDAGFWGTGGYYVSVVNRSDVVNRGERGFYAMASLSGYVVDEYLKKIAAPEEEHSSCVIIWDTKRRYDRHGSQLIIAALYRKKNKNFIRFLDMSRNVDGCFQVHVDGFELQSDMQRNIMEIYDHGNFDSLSADERNELWRKAPAHCDYLFPQWLINERASAILKANGVI